MPCCVRQLSSMQVCAVVCGPVARLGGRGTGPAAGNGCLHARRLLEGTEAMGNRERSALRRNKERGMGCSVACCPSRLGVRLKGGITPHSIQSMLTI